MTFADALALALRNLRQAKLRTFLTTLGVAIGIASLSGMVSLGVGLQDQFVGRFMRAGVFDSITVLPGAGDPRGFLSGGRGRGRGGRRGVAADPDRRPLDDAIVRELAQMPHVRDAYPLVRVPVEAKYGDLSEFIQALGVPMSSRGEGPFEKLSYGRFFERDDEPACMLSLDAAKRLDQSNPGSLIGKELTIGYMKGSETAAPVAGDSAPVQVQRVEARFPIVGIVERETGPGLGGNQVAPLMLPLGRAREMNADVVRMQGGLLRMGGAGAGFQTAIVKVTHPQHTQDVQDRIKQMGFSAFSLNDALQGAKRAFLILDIILGLVGSIALAVASLGIVNTMVMSILERTREIGIMKAIGGSDSDVRRIFLIEASAIGLAGGLAGIALGWTVGRIINFAANQYIIREGGTPGNVFLLPWWLIASAIGFSIAVSLLAGSYPARRAARLDPIQALRHD